MSVTITIGGIDRTTNIESSSLSLQRALTSQVDTLRFTVIKQGVGAYKPTVLDAVVVQEGATTIFGGQIVEINESVDGYNVERIECLVKDYSFDMDKTLVIQTYTSMTVNAIIADINTNFLPAGYNLTNVSCAIVIGYIAFNYEQPSKCLQQLAELTNFEWYVDSGKNIHFFSKSSKLAPFNLTDTGGNFIWESLKIKSDIKSIRNAIIVRGGTYQGSTVTESIKADGTRLNFTQQYKYSNVVVKVNSVTKTVGIDFLDDPALFDCLYNFNEKAVLFKTTTKPANLDLVEVSGNPHIPVIVKVKDVASVATYGTFEYKIIDKSIGTKQGARDRAKSELLSYAQTLSDGSFETVDVGLEVGQSITVNSTIRSISDTFIISRISSKLFNGTQFMHTVTLITTRTYGAIEFLQNLLMQKDKEIEIAENEVLDEIESAYETVTIADGDSVVISKVHNPQAETIIFGEVNTVQALNYAVEFCVGEQVPSGLKRQFILDGSLLG